MAWHRTGLTLCALLLLTAAPTADETDDYIRAQMAGFHLPGLSLAVLKNGVVIKAAAYGVSDIARRTPVTVDTVFKIGSVSKQFIATAIMLLVQDGRLRVDDPLTEYIDGTPAAWAPITIRHLLTHTAGIQRESPAFDPMKASSDLDVIKGLYTVPLRFTPGAKWEYSNGGYYILAEIITRVAGRPWHEFIHDRIFTPAGMKTTAPTNTRPTLPNRSPVYTGNDNAALTDEGVALRPSGAFLSTVMDLAKWDASLYSNRVLSESSRRAMWTPIRLNDATTYPYGFGWHAEDWSGRKVIWHGGGLPGFSSQFLRFTDEKLSVIVLANGNDADLAGIAARLALFYLPSSAPTQPTGRR